MRTKRALASHLLVTALLFPAVTAHAQTTPKPPVKAAPRATANDELIKLAKAGMSDDVILAVIAKTDKAKYDTSADALVKLKTAGVSDKAIAAILGISSSAPASAQPSTPSPAAAAAAQTTQHVGVSFDQPSVASLDGREAGIYLLNAKNELEQLEPAVYSGEASGGKYLHNVFGFVPVNKNAVVRSPTANQRVQTTTPTFYFFFENRGAGLSNTGGTFVGYMNSASSPNEFALARLKVSTDERQITVAKDSTIKDRVGIPSKDTIDVVFKKLRPGVYEVRPRNPLTPGEYCFFYQGGAADTGGVGKLFDFGVDQGAAPQ